MTDKILKDSARKIQDYLKKMGLDLSVTELPGSTRTAQEAAEAVGCSVAQIAKSLVFKNKETEEPILVIASGANRVDTAKLKKVTGIKFGRVDGNWVKDQVGFAIGGIPPAGHSKPLVTFLDPDLKKHGAIWAAAGTPYALFKLTSDDLETLTKGTWIDLAQE